MRTISRILLGTAAAASVATAGIAYAAPGQDGMAKARPDITRAQAQEQAGKMFDRMDANKDGKLDAADREARQKARFDRLDTNKDGSISREEFAARPDRTRAAPDGQKVDGKRFGGRHHGGWQRGGHGGMGMMKQGAGPITKADFVAAHLARFDAADTDRNGVLTAQERQAQREKMRAEWQAKRAAQPQQKAQ